MFLFGVILVRIFPHSDWIRRDIQSECGKKRARKLRIWTLSMQCVSLHLLHLLWTLILFLHSLNVGMMDCVEPATIYMIFAVLFSHILICATRFNIILAVTISIDLEKLILKVINCLANNCLLLVIFHFFI